ncbi:NAD(P)/FAD-dependent oxidoreductase [Pseudoxanthomonas sp. PXM02]|jgi:thioredoxin reductase|uniref:NAD(P)/FAD-dependent oxidoreductase n=1 Tax=Pseudoxanthomonas sp. PXM02 TaxID=2769294 RepID=UPI001782AE07|nr:NAD(P)/FAD-dependent oxidoreductase [Pseudoxanthomonas sp. PXM02]MBD9479077.1 NAD(P)/FAD-dependent oxidoreductase [Pseudoxanthomonas sp. PXM02]
MKNYDVIVVGGSYAGMAAALQLVRARRTVLVIDAGKRRNRAASHSHGFLSQDGADPAVIASTARTQLEAYPTLSWVDDLVVRASGSRDAFTVETATGEVLGARRLLLATGVSDTLPEVNGLAERWGISVFHCPYCHGYELDQGQIGVIAASPMSIHQAQLLPEWGSVTFLTNGMVELDEPTLQDLSARGVIVETTLIDRIEGHADVVLTDGRGLSFVGLFTAPKNAPSTSTAEELGCALAETPMGTQIQTSETKETTVAGAFACGDAARVPHSVSLAVADGAWAGAQIHRSLVWSEG